jgi:glutamate synthase domain-containing protein 3
MTGGLSYVLRGEADEVIHRDFVALSEIDAQEEAWLRSVLEEHLRFTASPRASRLLSRRGVLPFLRVQPIHFQGTLEATWEPLLARLKHREVIFSPPQSAALSRATLPA